MNDCATHDEVYFTTSFYATKSMDRDEAAITLMITGSHWTGYYAKGGSRQ
jgi:hypothetical protein